MLDQSKLATLDLPIGDLTKDQVRDLATQLDLRTATKPDSQDVCFITREHGRDDFLRKRIPLTPGRVINTEGIEVGSVEAVEMVTIGQRKGMATAGGTNPRYAINVDVPNATVTVGTPEDLLVESTSVKDCVWANQLTNGPVLVQISAHGKPMKATLKDNTVYWEEPQRRVAPGQAVVFYDNDEVLGGGMAC